MTIRPFTDADRRRTQQAYFRGISEALQQFAERLLPAIRAALAAWAPRRPAPRSGTASALHRAYRQRHTARRRSRR